MADDIVTRLRELREILMGNPIMAREVQEAMDEIERLRADRDKWKKLAKKRNPNLWGNLVRKRYGMEDMYER